MRHLGFCVAADLPGAVNSLGRVRPGSLGGCRDHEIVIFTGLCTVAGDGGANVMNDAKNESPERAFQFGMATVAVARPARSSRPEKF